jgi:hypothetical protein
LINETDWWRTGNPYGLPGTASLRLTQRKDGSWHAGLVGAELGDEAAMQSALDRVTKSHEHLAKSMMILGVSTAVMAGVATLGTLTAVYMFRRRRQ